MVTGFLQSVGHTIFRMGGASGDGVRSEGEDAGPMRLGHSGEPLYTTLVGHPVSDDNHSVTIGESGIVTFEDLHLFEKNAHFNRERIPERVVHDCMLKAQGLTVTSKSPST